MEFQTFPFSFSHMPIFRENSLCHGEFHLSPHPINITRLHLANYCLSKSRAFNNSRAVWYRKKKGRQLTISYPKNNPLMILLSSLVSIQYIRHGSIWKIMCMRYWGCNIFFSLLMWKSALYTVITIYNKVEHQRG